MLRRGNYIRRIATSTVKGASNFTRKLFNRVKFRPTHKNNNSVNAKNSVINLPSSNVLLYRAPVDTLEIKSKYMDILTSILEPKNLNLSDLMRALTKKTNLLITQCQAIGGFNVDLKLIINDKQELMSGHPEKIFERLGKTATDNLLALTEAGELVYKEKDLVPQDNYMLDFVKIGMESSNINDTVKGRIFGGVYFDDTVFMYKGFSSVDKELNFVSSNKEFGTNSLHKNGYKSLSNSKYISSDGINILNVHLPSNGPGNLVGIGKFVKDCLPTNVELGDVVPNVIVGDTNITCSKCGLEITLKNRACIMQEMVKAVQENYKDKWTLLMSATYVNKFRSYGVLLNQQPSKTTSKGEPEPDGTVIFIKMDGTLPTQMDKPYFGKNWILLCGDKFYTDIEKYKSKFASFDAEKELMPEDKIPDDEMPQGALEPTVVNFLKFDEEIDKCLDENGFLQDKLFIDHTPVQISLEAIKVMTGLSNPSVSWKNLVVLNVGSITNSSKKWDLDKLKCMDDIKRIDKELYENMITGTGDYEHIDGKKYANWMITQDNKDSVASLFADSEVELSKLECFQSHSNAPSSMRGGRYIKKSKRKSKGKIKTKRVKKIS